MTEARFDKNFRPTLIGVSSTDGLTPTLAEIDPNTGELLVKTTATVDTTGLATDTNQTNGAQKTQIVDAGGEVATVTGGKLDVNATASLAGTALPISGATEAVGVAIVDGSGNQVTSFGGGTQYTEDAPAATNPIGTALNMVRDDARGGSLTTADGDNVAARGTNAGELYVKHVDSIPVTDNGGSLTVDATSLPLPTGAATSAKQDTGNTSLASIDGKITAVNTGAVVVSSSALPTGAATAAKQPALGTAGTASSDVVTVQGIASMTALKTDGSAVTQPISAASLPLPTGAATAALQTQPGVDIGDVTVNNASGASAVNIQDGGNSITVDGTVTANAGSGTFNIQSNASVNVAQMNGVTTTMGNGVAGTGVQRVAIASDNTVLPGVGAGTTGSTPPANASYNGLLAKTANPSAATDGNLVGALSDKLGKQVVVGSIRDLKGNQFTTITSSTSETTVVTAVASTFLDVYGVIVENTSATASKVTFKDSTGGTTQFEIYVPAGDTRGFMLPESGAFKQTTVNNNWTATCGTSVASIVITVLYVKNI